MADAVLLYRLQPEFGAGRRKTATPATVRADVTLIDTDGVHDRAGGGGAASVHLLAEVQPGEHLWNGEQGQQQAVAVQALREAATGVDQTGVAQTRSACRAPPIPIPSPAISVRHPARNVVIPAERVVASSSPGPSHEPGVTTIPGPQPHRFTRWRGCCAGPIEPAHALNPVCQIGRGGRRGRSGPGSPRSRGGPRRGPRRRVLPATDAMPASCRSARRPLRLQVGRATSTRSARDQS